MKRLITLILMVTTLLTFTQKATAFAPVLENETHSMINCTMSMGVNQSQMDMDKSDCANGAMLHTSDCQSACDFMTMVPVLYFINYEPTVFQAELQLTFQSGKSAAPNYFPESLYRPPFMG